MKNIFTKALKSFFAVIMIALIMLVQAPTASAARLTSISDLDKARVSFTFDDGFASTRTLAAPILEARGIDGVLYLSSGAPDGTLILDDNQPSITWDQVRELQNVYGWEIGGHSEIHSELPTLTQEALRAELENSTTRFAENGLTVTNFASPFGAYDNNTLPEILKFYKTQRGFADRDTLNGYPYPKAILTVQSVEEGVTNAQVQAWVDQAIAEKRWLILVYHDIAPQHNPDYVYTNTTAELTAHANYVQSKVLTGQIDAVTIEEGVTLPGANVVQNSGFESGLANGWTSDNATGVKVDNNNNGNYGSPVQSINMTGTATAGHLFYNNLPVTYNSSYVIDAFVNAIDLTNGEVGFYIDEYDASGNYISGQWLGMITNGTVGFFTRLYNSTSELVNTIRIQIYMTAGATGTAYIDSVNLYNLDGAPTVTPTPTVNPNPTVTPTAVPSGTPTGANVVVNGEFDNGLAEGWTTDNATNVIADANGGTNVIRMTGNALAAHLFYNGLAINPATAYVFKATADTTGLTTGELGYFIDEYDATGTYISGQYLGNVINSAVSNFEFIYKATSGLVTTIRLQTYLTAGSTGSAVVDNYELRDPNATPSATPTPTIIVEPTVAPTAAPTDAPTPTAVPTVEPTVAPTAMPTPEPTGFKAEYFNNQTLTGTPVVTRYEESVNNDWGGGSPDAAVNADGFSARWTKTETFEAGTYNFTVTGDDGIRLLIDGEVVIDKFIDQAPTTYRAAKTLTVGTHIIVVEYYEKGGGAVAKFSYAKAPEVPAPANEYKAEYFNNKDHSGVPALTRNEATIDANWGGGSPDATVNADNFSARWSRTLTLVEGTYAFSVTADDGVRVLVDGEEIINGYINQAPTTYTAQKALAAGNHTIMVEYFESTGGAVAQFSYTLADTNTTPAPTDSYAVKFWNLPTSGTPAIPVSAPNATRNDVNINFDWANGAPEAGINVDRFAAQWIKSETFEEGTYTFTTISDDGIRVYIDNELIIDQWNDHAASTYTAEKVMTAGQHEVRVEYYDSMWGAVAKFNVEKVGAPVVIEPSDTFTAQFYNNTDLLGSPVLTRQDAAINFEWSNMSPDALINVDNFSARWIKVKQFAAGTYTFNLSSDDGIRFYIDDQLVVNDWTGHALTSYTVSVPLTEGLHTLKLEYFEATGGSTITLQEN